MSAGRIALNQPSHFPCLEALVPITSTQASNESSSQKVLSSADKTDKAHLHKRGRAARYRAD